MFVNHAAAQGSGSTGALTSVANFTGATLLYVGTSGFFGAPTPSDSTGVNTYTPITTQTNSGVLYSATWYCANPTVSATMTFSTPGANYYETIAVIGLSGTLVSSPLDTSASTQTVASAVVPGSLTVASGEVTVTYLGLNATSGSASINSSFTITDQAIATGSTEGYAMAYNLAAVSPAAPTWTISIGVAELQAHIATFLPNPIPDTITPPIPGVDSTRQTAQRAQASRTRLAQSLNFAIPLDAPNVMGTPTDPAISPIPGERSYWESQQNLANRAQYATFQQFGGPSETPVLDTAIQPVIWTALYQASQTQYRVRAAMQSALLWNPPADQSTIGTQPDTWIQPIPGERSYQFSVLVNLRRAGLASSGFWQIPADPGVVGTQPDTYQPPIPGSGIYALSQLAGRTRSALASRYLWTLPEDLTNLPAQGDSFQPPIQGSSALSVPGAGSYGIWLKTLSQRSALATRYLWHLPEDSSVSTSQPDTYQQPIPGTGIYAKNQQTIQRQARTATQLTWSFPTDQSGPTIIQDTYQPPIPGLGIAARATQLVHAQRVLQAPLVFTSAQDFSFTPFTGNGRFMHRIDGWAEQGNQSLTMNGVPMLVPEVQGSFPGCTVTVYNAGTLTLATIFGDEASPPTPKANPFTSDGTGYWFFYASGRFDVRFSGTGIATPFTLGDQGTYDQLLDIRDFGAQGLGNDDASIAAAVAWATANPQYRGLYFPPGTWTITNTTILITTPLILRGSGMGNTILNVNSQTIHGITVASSYVTVQDLDIMSTVVGRTGDGIHVPQNTGAGGRYRFLKFECLNCYGHFNGIYSAGVLASWRQCTAYSNFGHGFFFDATTSVSQGMSLLDVDFCEADSNLLNGFYVSGTAEEVKFNQCLADENGGYGLSCDATTGGVPGFGSHDIFVTSCKYSGNYGGIFLNGMQRVLLANTYYETNAQQPNLRILNSIGVTVTGGWNQLATHPAMGIGVWVVGSSLIAITGMEFNTNTVADVVFDATAAQVAVTGCLCNGSPICLRFDGVQAAPMIVTGGFFVPKSGGVALAGTPAAGTRIVGAYGLTDLNL
jgi:Pectate lyase superfamily protein